MSQFKSQVGPWKLNWKTIPRGQSGTVVLETPEKKWIEIQWRRDSDGIWILFPDGMYGFDFRNEIDESGRTLYHVLQRGTFNEWSGLLGSRGVENEQLATSSPKNKSQRIKAQMPGKIIRVMVSAGQEVQKDQPIIVMEAMKMENEIRATQAGIVSQIQVIEGQAVETGASLASIDPIPV